ncbi:MAG: cell division protein SepF [Butyricicoccus sp.]|nr:cell division protein SepF [Butyricicoccus sp.]
MGFFDELKKLTRPYDDDEDDFIDESVAPPPAEGPRRVNPFSGGYAAEQAATAQGARTARQPREGRVVSINGGAAHQQTKLVLVKPERFDTAAEIADHLREGHSIVMNLETTPNDDARRLIDFLSGVTYALDGKIQKAALKTYVIVPKNADLAGDIAGDLETGGTYF